MSEHHIKATTAAGKTSRIEKFSAVLLTFIGTVYLGVWIISIFSETGSFVTMNEDKVAISKSELFSHARTLITIVLSLTAGISIFRKQRIGFILGIAVLILFLMICSGGLYQAFKLRETPLIAFAGGIWLILLSGIVILFLPGTRRRLHTTRLTILISLLITILLALFYFFVQ